VTVAKAADGPAADSPKDKWGQMPKHRLTKQQKAEGRPKTTGASHFDMTAPQVTPELKREIQALRLHTAMDPKRFLRGEAKRDSAKLPEFFQIGHVVDPGRRATTEATPAKLRKRGFLEALVEDTEARGYAKKKYAEVQRGTMSGRGGGLHGRRSKARR